MKGSQGEWLSGDEGQWKKPIFGELKLNCDATLRKDTKVGGVGWVLRDFARILKLTGRVGGELFAAAIMEEAETIRQRMEMIIGSDVMEAGTRLMVESTSKGLIQMLSKKITVDVYLDIYFQDI